MSSKVFLDTCVLVSASVYGTCIDLGIEIQHQFYEKTVPLLDIIKKHINKRIGIITVTIEKQSIGVIASAVASELEQRAKKLDDIELRAKLFESHAVFFDQCLSHLEKIISILQREPVVSPIEQEQCYVDVCKMYIDLQTKANNLDIDAIISANVTRRYRPAIYRELRKQLMDQFKQLRNLKTKPVEESDKKILCEVITLLQLYKKTNPNIRMFLASTDYHFSPSESGGEIAKQIEQRFQITCDWPDKVANYLCKLQNAKGML